MNIKKIRFKGDVSVYVLLMLGMAIGMYLMGFTSVFFSSISDTSLETVDDDSLQLETQGQNDIGAVFDRMVTGIIRAFTDTGIVLPMVGFSLLSGIAGKNYSGGTILSFIIPVMLLFAVVNIFFFPIVSTIQTEGSGGSGITLVSTLLSIIFNCMLFLSVLEYTAGRN